MSVRRIRLAIAVSCVGLLGLSACSSGGGTSSTDAMGAAKQASRTSTQGNQVVRSAIGSIEQVSRQIEQAGSVVQQLETDSTDMSMVLDVIRDIAGQINLRALNADQQTPSP